VENDIKWCENTPNMGKLMREVVPFLGHDIVSAFADLIDNSLDARSSKIQLFINSGNNGTIDSFYLVDNGIGMDAAVLIESNRFCTNTIHTKGDLGKFGVGGTVASFTIADKKTTLTKKKNGALIVATQDMDWFDDPELDQTKTVAISIPTKDQKLFFEDCCGESGTIVILEKLKPNEEYTRAGNLKNKLVKEYSLIFSKMLSDNRELIISTPGASTKIEPFDPFYEGENSAVEWSTSEDLGLSGCSFKVKCVLLNLSMIEDKAYKDQGIYLYRNGRLIIKGADLGIWTKNPRYNAGRVSIEMTEESDHHVKTGALKNKATFSQAFRDKIRDSVKVLRKKCDDYYVSDTSQASSKKLQKEQKKFEDSLISNAGVLNLPKKEAVVNVQILRKQTSSKTGTVLPKGTNKTRKPKTQIVKQKSQTRICPSFSVRKNGRHAPHIEYDFGSDKNDMVVIINSNHPYIIDNYLKGNAMVKKVLHTEWASQCLVEFNSMDLEDDYSIINNYRSDVARHITKIYKYVK